MMMRRTLPRAARAHAPGWAHPYPAVPWAPLYADGGDDPDDGGDGDPDDGGTGDDPDDGGDPGDDGGQGQGGGGGQSGDAPLGPAGEQALARVKEKYKAERAKRRAAESKLNAPAAGTGGDGGGTDAAEAARQEAERAAMVKANQRILRSEVRAAAAGKLSDPSDALKLLDLDSFEVGADGDVDSDELADAIDDLIKTKPYLAAQGRPRFQGTADGGAQRKAGRPKQLTESDLKTMTPEQIVKAQDKGELDDLLGAS